MIGDSVREELALKISPIAKSNNPEIRKEMPPPAASFQPVKMQFAPPPAPAAPVNPVVPAVTEELPPLPASSLPPLASEVKSIETTASVPPTEKTSVGAAAAPQQPQIRAVAAPNKPETTEIIGKPTSPTLRDFRHDNSALPEWRLQVQNAVRRRQDYRGGDAEDCGGLGERTSAVSAETLGSQLPQHITLATNGATALKPEPVTQQKKPVPTAAPAVKAPPAAAIGNPKLEAALRRIEQSRQIYGAPEEKPRPQLTVVAPPSSAAAAQSTQAQQPKNFPFVVNPQPTATATAAAAAAATIEDVSAPKPLARTFVIEKKAEKFDTNKLPPLAHATKSGAGNQGSEKRALVFKAKEDKAIIGETDEFSDVETSAADVVAYAETGSLAAESEDFEEIDDCAPVSLRFNAGLFDLIIGAFLSFVLLAPFTLLNGNMFTFQGLLAFAATWAIVMFIYLTVTIGFLGRTFGMRLFSLEIVDIEENEYPTFHQAAVNSCVYLFSLALGGIGFLPLFFNSERRAAHDLLSGTIVVKEEY